VSLLAKASMDTRDAILSWLRFYSTEKRYTLAEVADSLEEKFGDYVGRYWIVDTIRERGWAVAVHNDYRQDGLSYTFWLFTKGDRCAKGEGLTDYLALVQVLGVINALEDP